MKYKSNKIVKSLVILFYVKKEEFLLKKYILNA
ncbi:hypothetical protein SAMN04489757_13317 [Anaerocolumna aminovalerica]|uniref:Uncharacterized protein n=1 Tax=Anaerocolumna aminovalerica TaxID=1527 RepID=A0A1I5HRR4_9FIRM|nr:hypothetical protein SAMN04489757_13317 [Anaerocolumna aminovalerica]